MSDSVKYIKYNGGIEASAFKKTGGSANDILIADGTTLDTSNFCTAELAVSLQQQIDGEISSWFFEGEPSTSNAPANDWMTEELKQRHEGDTYTDITTYVDNTTTPTAGQSWRWCKGNTTGDNVGWHWHKIADSDAVKALAEAAKAQQLANTAQSTANIAKTTADAVRTDFDNLEIGGRNLFLNSAVKKWINWAMKTSPTVTINDAVCNVTTNSAENIYLYISFGTFDNDFTMQTSTLNWKDRNVLVSVEILSPIDIELKLGLVFRIKKLGSSTYTNIDGSYYNGKYNIVKANTWTQIYGIDNFAYNYDEPITIDGVQYSTDEVNKYLVIGSKTAVSSGNTFKFKNFKLEFGTKPTDWTPAPEDVDSKADAIKAIADGAAASAKRSNDQLANMSNDSILTPQEKGSVADEWACIQKEYAQNSTNKTTAWGSATVAEWTAYNNAYTTLQTYVGTLALTDRTNNTNIVKSTFQTNFANYYSANVAFLNALSKKAAELEVAAMEIGGRNLLLQTDINQYIDKWSVWQSSKVLSNGWCKVTQNSGASSVGIITPKESDGATIENGHSYILSFDCYLDTSALVDSIDANYCYLMFSSGGNYVIDNYAIINKTPRRVSIPFTFSSNRTEKFGVMIGCYGTNIPAFYIKDVKLEKGTKATDWTPAPEDVDAAINSKLSSLTPGIGLTGTSNDSAITISGTINLKNASASEIGGIKVGNVNTNSVTKATEGSNYYPVNIDSTGLGYVALPAFKTTDNNTTYTFEGGTNEFTVTTSGGKQQSVSVTPSIDNNITGSGTFGCLAVFDNTNVLTSGPQLGNDNTTFLRNDGVWATSVTKIKVGLGLYLQTINEPHYSLPNLTGEGLITLQLGNDTQSTYYSNNDNSIDDRQYGVGLDADDKLSVNIPWTDTNVTLTKLTADGNYPLLCKYNTNDTSTTNSVKFVSGITVNPYTQTIKTPKLNISHHGAGGNNFNNNVKLPVTNKALVIGTVADKTTCLYINRSGIQAWNSTSDTPLDSGIPSMYLQGAGGNVICGGGVNATAFYETSDIRKKEIKSDLSLDKCYDLIDKCQTVIYSLKDQTKEQIGMIAQEIEEFFPEVVDTDEEGFKSLAYDRLVVICFKVLKDVIKRLEKLES